MSQPQSIPDRALSIRCPWQWFVLHGGKDVENRKRWTSYRGTVLVHASSWWQPLSILQHLCAFSPLAKATTGRETTLADLQKEAGCIVGMVDIVDCVTKVESPWFFGPYGYSLANPIPFKRPVPCKGALGFFRVPADVLAQLEVA
ncbi:ASCH domain-containing protein [Azospirillum sp. B4]|uniref:ASCH domain-containing protein n=1 Tax=Azospirillum sp. B4 TaxID=95605 RepID=UPI0003482FE8|nr:ASCH domain-containing protein [Azospirillum sp. B4]